jgi:two-component system, chemotaxis family, sensor kinase CheA
MNRFVGVEPLPERSLPAVTTKHRFVSVASRLAVVIFALVAAVSLLVAFELMRRERAHYLDAKQRAGTALTELFAASVGPALDFADAEALASSASMLAQNKDVVDAAVWAADGGAPMTRLHRSGDPSFLAVRTPGIVVAEDHLDIVRPVSSPIGKRLGVVAVRVSLAQERAAFESSRRRILWFTIVLSAAVAALLVAVVRRTIVTPLAGLERAARKLGEGELAEVVAKRHDEIGRLAHTFNDMSRTIREREERVFAVNARLQGLLDTMRQAILVFDRSGALGPERSKLARALFGDVSGPGTSIVDLLYPEDRAAAVEREAFTAWLAEAGEPDVDLDELSELAPREVTLALADGAERLLELEFRRAPGEDGDARFMLLCTDVTSQRRLERTADAQARDHEKQLAAMRRLLAGGGQVFVRFLGMARARLARAVGSLVGKTRLDPGTVDSLYSFAHTLRAEARSFDLKSVEEIAAGIELELAGIRHVPLDSSVRGAAAGKVAAALSRLAAAFDQAESLFVQSSPIGRRVLEQVTVSRRDLDALVDRLKDHRSDGLAELAERLAARPFGELTSTLPDAVDRWSAREGKRLELVIEGREALVPAALAERLGGVLAHLVRNAIAHGIETPAERQMRGKPELGRVVLRCEEERGGVLISVLDDGAGFDEEALRRAARDSLRAPGLEVAFAPGVTTRVAADDLAGHGVGLGAVRDALEEAGYAVSLDSRRGAGAKISIERHAPQAEVRHA